MGVVYQLVVISGCQDFGVRLRLRIVWLFVVIFAPIIEVGNSKSSRKFSQCPVVRSSTGSSRSRSHKHQHYCERSQRLQERLYNIAFYTFFHSKCRSSEDNIIVFGVTMIQLC